MRTQKSFGIGIALALLLAAACERQAADAVRVRGDGAELAVRTEPSAPRVGSNALRLELRDASGAPLSGADVAVRVHMHAMGAMPAMGGPAAVREEGEGRYRADFDLPMGGSWLVEVTAKAGDTPLVRAEGSLGVGTAGLRLEAVGTAPAGAEPHAHAMTTPAEDAASGALAAADDAHPGEFRVDPGRLQRVGVRVTRVERKSIESSVRAVGRVVAEETTLADVSLKVRGWVGRIEIDAIGDPVAKGQVLVRIYSPELYTAQEELLQALRSQERAKQEGSDRTDYLVRAARNRLRLWDISAADIDAIAARGEPQRDLPIRAPVTGYVVEKNVSLGSAFEPGARLYRIAQLARVWVEAEVYEFELASVSVGQRATVSLPALPGSALEAQVAYVYPTLDPKSRTGRVRLELPNPELALRPDMYASVRLHVSRGEGLVVPHSAVLYAGERSFVFRALGEGRFRPQQVVTGMRSGEEVEVLSGVAEGDAIVASGTFLIASESRLRAALERW
jgi:Cu(I)/Ag(I) efflux system membrane fusion protein